ncbi:MAG: hypothetical protein ABH841_00955 [Candidatus Nealsonbacteria bacterium]
MAEQQGKKEETMIICNPNGSKCNICGAFIPDGDIMCCNGHEAGKKYPVPVTK